VALRNARSLADLKHLNRTVMALNEELEEANTQYEKLDSVKTDFITIASHELRTPLAQVRGYVDILEALNEQGMLDQDQTSGMVNNLRKAIDRTEELLTAMLDMSQLDVNAMDLRFTQASAESVVRMAIEPLTEYIKQRKLTLSARGLRGLPMIHCDMQRLVQALRNIVTNAIKFTPDGGRIDITASLQTGENGGDDYVLIAISDTGVGIESENLELVFEKFYRAYDPSLHSTGSYKFMGAGPGLGLTIAKGVIESHGGKVWAESSGHNMETFPGTTFYITLPVNPPEEARRVLIEDPMATSNDHTPVSRSTN
jgi:signal transduction histidine kinase